MDLIKVLGAERVLAIVRTSSADRAVSVCADLLANGVPLVEISLNTPGASEAIAEVKRSRSSPGTANPVGAGTVLTASDVRAAAEAGADFLVTPGVLADVLAEAAKADLPVLTGAYTATEVLAAWRAGAAAIKLFPASAGGPSYLSALRKPMPDIPFVVVGGVTIESVPGYLAAGALAVGIGTPLVEGDLRENCARLREVLP